MQSIKIIICYSSRSAILPVSRHREPAHEKRQPLAISTAPGGMAGFRITPSRIAQSPPSSMFLLASVALLAHSGLANARRSVDLRCPRQQHKSVMYSRTVLRSEQQLHRRPSPSSARAGTRRRHARALPTQRSRFLIDVVVLYEVERRQKYPAPASLYNLPSPVTRFTTRAGLQPLPNPRIIFLPVYGPARQINGNFDDNLDLVR